MKNVYHFDEAVMEAIGDFAVEYWEIKGRANSERFRDASDPTRRLAQKVIGKLGEEAVHQMFGTTPPDYTIYPRGAAMPPADLMLDGCRVHVKTAIWPENSWIADPNTDNIVFKPREDDLVVFCVFRQPEGVGGEVEVLGMIQANKLSGLWMPPLSNKLMHKRALYWEGTGGFNPPPPLRDHPELIRWYNR